MELEGMGLYDVALAEYDNLDAELPPRAAFELALLLLDELELTDEDRRRIREVW